MTVRVGTSGWVYKHWIGDFYPPQVKAKERFLYYASQFDTVELNGSFYRLPLEKTVLAWRSAAPPGFLFACKGSKYITHNKKIKDAEDSIALVEGRLALLGDHLGPTLYQLPPQLKRDDGRLARFLSMLPRDRRHVLEFRHPSWYAPEVLTLLSEHDVALCISDHHHAPAPWEATARFVYIRGHGPGGRYVGRYGPAVLADWAKAIRRWEGEARPVFVYFDNDIGGSAPRDAADLKTILATP